jgi:molybdate/tungstate transport system substrate-binding protein
MLMYSTPVLESGRSYADWTLQWAGNELVLAYNPESHYADEVNSENWHEIIAAPDVRFGISDPRFDASGYRTLMIAQMAESFYGDPTIFEKIFLGRFKEAISVKKESGQQVIHVPELLETTDTSNIIVRGGSVALLALLESGDIDYAFEYESVARQHGLKYIALPPDLNLGDPNFAADYQAVKVVLDFQRFSSVMPIFEGEPVTYGLTIPSNAPHPAEAEEFLQFLLGQEGRAILASNYHPMWDQFYVDHPNSVPENLLTVLP